MDNVERAVTMDCKREGDLVYIIGTTWNELGGSQYYGIHGYVGNRVPRVDPKKGKKVMDVLSAVMEMGLVKACHDLSEGGVGVAAAEMAFAGGLGMVIHLGQVPLGEAMNRNDGRGSTGEQAPVRTYDGWGRFRCHRSGYKKRKV